MATSRKTTPKQPTPKKLPSRAASALCATFAKHGLGNVALSLAGDRWTFGRVETRQLKDLGAALLKPAKKG